MQALMTVLVTKPKNETNHVTLAAGDSRCEI